VHTWKLQQAKSRLSEVVDQALENGPQVITCHGKETAIVVSVSDYRRLATPNQGLVDFLRSSPLAEGGIDLERDPDPGRAIEL